VSKCKIHSVAVAYKLEDVQVTPQGLDSVTAMLRSSRETFQAKDLLSKTALRTIGSYSTPEAVVTVPGRSWLVALVPHWRTGHSF